MELVELPRDLAQVTDQQLEAVYTAVASGETKVKRLSVRMSSIELELVAKAVNSLEYLGATLSSRQAEVILTQSLVKTSLNKMLLRIKGPLRVDQDIVTEAKKVIKGLVVTHLN